MAVQVITPKEFDIQCVELKEEQDRALAKCLKSFNRQIIAYAAGAELDREKMDDDVKYAEFLANPEHHPENAGCIFIRLGNMPMPCRSSFINELEDAIKAARWSSKLRVEKRSCYQSLWLILPNPKAKK